MPRLIASVKASSTWLNVAARAEDADARDHPLPGADHRDRLVGGEVGRLVERLHRRELVARAEEDVDVRLRQVAVPAEMLTTRFGR